ncbi:hypothetical protein ACH5RR_012005 [Cinchona calisaya]|uniref:Acyl transferase 4 n=1 Tax=Cinchona calisaya TaxID=153742 RepID=A0ABD3A6N3_9GENT
MDFIVRRTSHGLVPPSEPTPSDVLELSIIDRQPALRCIARTLHVFRHATAHATPAGRVIREALGKALVPYYPLAGRLKFDSAANFPRLQIECCGAGIWFVEANVDCSLQEVDYFENATSIPYETLEHLLPPPPPHGLDPLVLIQITQFKCNGFVMGLMFSHAICDGVGAAQFMKAVGEMARGAERPSITPSWSRELIQSPSLEAYLKSFPTTLLSSPQPPIPPYKLEHANIDISSDDINSLKQNFLRQTGGQRCSTFDIVAASLWRHRTRAISDTLKENEELILLFFANCRKQLSQLLPEGFYGNCFFPIIITATCEMLKRASLVDVVKMIQEAKANLTIEFGKWIDCGVVDVDPFFPPMLYTTLFISEWGRLGFNEVDYGWGPPVHFTPIQDTSIMPVGIVGCQPSPRSGIRLMTWCVEKAHLQSLANWPTGLEDDVQ